MSKSVVDWIQTKGSGGRSLLKTKGDIEISGVQWQSIIFVRQKEQVAFGQVKKAQTSQQAQEARPGPAATQT